MGTPFTTGTPVLARRLGDELATYAQLQRALVPMLRDRNWQSAGLEDSWVRRIAVIAATLHIAEQVATDPQMADQLKIQLFDRHDLHGTFHQLMEFNFASAVNDERDATPSKPLTKKGATFLIDALSKLEWKNTAATSQAVSPVPSGHAAMPPAEVVPAGRYAIEIENSAVGNDLAFYKVDRPTEGRWAGYVFVKMIVGPDEQRLSRALSITIMDKIAAVGAETAAARYGHETRKCGFCHTNLTNKESRDRGIGPDCFKKYLGG